MTFDLTNLLSQREASQPRKVSTWYAILKGGNQYRSYYYLQDCGDDAEMCAEMFDGADTDGNEIRGAVEVLPDGQIQFHSVRSMIYELEDIKEARQAHENFLKDHPRE